MPLNLESQETVVLYHCEIEHYADVSGSCLISVFTTVQGHLRRDDAENDTKTFRGQLYIGLPEGIDLCTLRKCDSNILTKFST